MGLYRERGKKSATLRIVGRDLEEDLDLALAWDAECLCWQWLGDATEVARDALQAAILAAVAALDGQATTTQVAEHLGRDKSNISKEIQELVAKGQLVRGPKRGKDQYYRRPSAF
jgi:hypothetical protein